MMLDIRWDMLVMGMRACQLRNMRMRERVVPIKLFFMSMDFITVAPNKLFF